MHMNELQTRHQMDMLQDSLLFLYEQTTQYLQGLEANFVTQLSRTSCKGLRSALR